MSERVTSSYERTEFVDAMRWMLRHGDSSRLPSILSLGQMKASTLETVPASQRSTARLAGARP